MGDAEKDVILIVEDEQNLRDSLIDNLEMEGFVVYGAELLADARQIICQQKIDLIVLDIMLPDGDGYNFCEEIRQTNDCMVLMLTARTLEQDIVDGFQSGADDYLTKPYRSSELILRIQALLRRKSVHLKDSMTDINGFLIDWKLRKISDPEGHAIHVTKTAFELLSFLYRNSSKVCSREEILSAVWGEDVYVDNRTVDNFVSNLKKSFNLVEGNPWHIRTCRGVGYCLDNTPASSLSVRL